MNKGQFSSDRQPEGKKPRGKGARTLILEALGKNNKTEEEFFEHVVRRALMDGEPSSAQLIKEVLGRLAPTDKATLPKISLDLSGAQTPAEKIDAIIEAVAREEVSPDVAAIVVGMIKDGIQVREITELAERLERLEALLNAQADSGKA